MASVSLKCGPNLAVFSLAILVEDFGISGNQKIQLDSLPDQQFPSVYNRHTTIDIRLITHIEFTYFEIGYEKRTKQPVWPTRASNLRNLQIL